MFICFIFIKILRLACPIDGIVAWSPENAEQAKAEK
jgi:hypothetical protein